jgi:hypothetical protein
LEPELFAGAIDRDDGPGIRALERVIRTSLRAGSGGSSDSSCERRCRSAGAELGDERSTTMVCPAMSSPACESLSVMVSEFDARLQKGDNPGAWTCVVMDDAAELFGTRGLVKIRGAIDGEAFDGALMAQGDGTHRLPVKAKLRKAIGKEAGDTVHVRIDERIG